MRSLIEVFFQTINRAFKKQGRCILQGKWAPFHALTFLKVQIVNNTLKNDDPDASRKTPDYAKALQLLREKKELQAVLRDVDRRLRELEVVAAGVISVARYDIDHDSCGSSST